MTELATIATHAPVEFTSDQIGLIKRTICKPKDRDATNDELALFVGQAKRTGLDPFARQIYSIFRWDNQLKAEKMTIQVAIDGFRLVAERSGVYLGQSGPFWCDGETQWTDVWLKATPPAAAKVIVRKIVAGQIAETPAVAHYSEYVGTDRNGQPTRMWREKSSLMLAKCAEALALRKAFPNDLSGLYTAEEMSRADEPVVPLQVTSEPVVSDVPAPASWPTETDAPPADDVPWEGEAVEETSEPAPGTIDPAYVNDIADEMKRRKLTVGQFRSLLAGVGVDCPPDLRAEEKRIALLSTLTQSQAADLVKGMSVIPAEAA